MRIDYYAIAKKEFNGKISELKIRENRSLNGANIIFGDMGIISKTAEIQRTSTYRINRILKSNLIIIDEIGYTPIDTTFQIPWEKYFHRGWELYLPFTNVPSLQATNPGCLS